MAQVSVPADRIYRHEIAVRWADCDPAQIAYTGRIPYFCLDALDAFWGHAAGHDWFSINVDRNTGTPFVHLSLDFRKPVTPRHILVCEVRLTSLGETSVGFSVNGYQGGELCFEGRFVEVFVDAKAMTKTKPPVDIRERLAAWLS